MQILPQSFEIINREEINGKKILKQLEKIGRVCWKSEDKITSNSYEPFVKMLLGKNHLSVLEHFSITVKLITDRGISHEIVRHRLGSYTQSSTRYVFSTEKSNNKISTEHDVLEHYENGLSMKKISNLSLGKYTEWDIYKILDKNSIKRRGLNNKGIINEDFFYKIDAPEKAYLIGLIQADGNLRKENEHKSYDISIVQKDGWYIERMLRTFIRDYISKSKDRNCFHYTICNKKLYSDLLKKGIIPNKSYDMKEKHANLLWKSIPNKLKWDFLRGFMDGDGGVRFFKQNNISETESCNLNWAGNYFLLQHIVKWFEKNFNYFMNIRKLKECNDLYRITITKPEIALKYCKLAYKNFIFPYGNPVKTSRVFDYMPFKFNFASWGDPKFQVISPFNVLTPALWVWAENMDNIEDAYKKSLYLETTPEIARSELPNGLKTEIYVTYNLRQWKHVFETRCAPAAHPQMRELMTNLKNEFKTLIPIIFEN